MPFIDADTGTILNGPIYFVTDLPDEDMTDTEAITYALDSGTLVK